jgi:multidrug efflux pump subunit AcrB
MKLENLGLAGRIAQAFVRSKLTPLIVLASLLAGFFAAVSLPREEEPQISVPMFDILVPFPGANAQEVQDRLSTLGQRKLMEIPDVEYVYATAENNFAMFIVRFKVGTDGEEAMTRLFTKVHSNADFVPQGAPQPLIKPRSIDDVPILALTFHGDKATQLELRRTAAAVRDEISSISEVSETTITGGKKRQFLVRFSPEKLARLQITPQQLAGIISSSNINLPAGRTADGEKGLLVETDSFIRNIDDLKNTIVGLWDGRPVPLSQVAQVTDGPDEDENSVTIYDEHGSRPAVTLSIAKRKGANATRVSEEILSRAEAMRAKGAIPTNITWTVTRDYGHTAKEKSDELLFHMLLATLSVTLLIAFALGIREALVVLVSVPVTLGLTLLVYFLAGYTLNRITLFALIFSIGILVDDAIVVVENIHRHWTLDPDSPKWQTALRAVDEVGNPTILATLAVIASILPMAFVSGMMGPYMMPIPVGASVAMILSLGIAFIISPWLFTLILEKWTPKKHIDKDHKSFTDKLYIKLMHKLFANRKALYASLIITFGLAALSMLLVVTHKVQAKMLPFDNKNEFQVILNMPESSSFELTQKAADEVALAARTLPEAADVQAYVGAAAPYNFNGLVRHYFMRTRPWQADIQVNLAPKDARKRQSHQIASAARPMFQAIAAKYGARLQVAEVPPGPPVLSTLVIEVYNDDAAKRNALALDIKNILANTKGIVDIDSYLPEAQPQTTLVVNRQKATLNGISSADIAQTAHIALNGADISLAHVAGEAEPVSINLRLPQEMRKDESGVKSVRLFSANGTALQVGSLTEQNTGEAALPLYQKNMQKVTYVTAEVAGEIESPVYAILELRGKIDQLAKERGIEIKQFYARQPDNTGGTSIKWDGEWQVTYEVFRDMGISFAMVLILIYVLVVAWFGSFSVPLIIMAPIPLTLVGVLTGHWMAGSFFTATSMIGFIAGAGIEVRSSIILVDFIKMKIEHGESVAEACIQAGLARFRPMLLTAAAVVVAGAVILFDPIFQGLAISLIGGAIASTVLSRTSVPTLYYLFYGKKNKKGN